MMSAEPSASNFSGPNTPSNGTLLGPNPLVNHSVGNSFNASPSSSNVLKLSNLPSDLTQREASLIFSLVIDEIVSIEIKDYKIIAYFKNLSTCVTTGKLLEGKFVFGGEYGPVSVEYDNSTLNSPSTLASSASNTFNSLRLSNTNISPPNLHSQPQPPSATSSSTSNNSGNPQNFDNFQKRQSIGNQRSRFVFSDPFGGANPPNASNTGGTNATGTIDLTDLTGKSLLLMESQNDAREYDNLVRDPWGSTGSIPINSAPQTPGIASATGQAPFDWSSNQSSATAGSSDRRRTSSAFFNNNLHNPLSSQSSSSTLLGSQQSNQSSNVQPQSNGTTRVPSMSLPSHNQVSMHSQSSVAQQPSSNVPASNNSSATNSSQPHQAQRSPSGSSSQVSSQPGASQNQMTNVDSNSMSAQSTNANRQQTTKDVPDLSLLARVPPPANPADQNPPCNTLYVGNLPPDATEAELRSLFSPQKGFRRLSFRTKNLSSSNPNNSNTHNHGPMCFVEFEDVAHATRALAELYGRALPRPNGGNGKGGIRLSFSKNPLGVRGPGNARRTGGNPVSGSATTGAATTNGSTNGNGNGTASNSANANGVGNYGYSNFHQK